MVGMMKRSPTTLVACCVLFVAIVTGRGVVVVESRKLSGKFPALIVFGDSNVDPGNNDYIDTIAKSNFAPYGRDFAGGQPTGRFSNGKVPSDLIAEALGIKELLPPYLDPNLTITDLLTGVSFASGGAGYDPLSAQQSGALQLSDQLNYFEQYKEKLKAKVGDNTTQSIISNSLYLTVVGSNDITNTYFMNPMRRLSYSLDSYADLLVGFASTFFQDLYKAGARQMGIVGAPPAGCLPSQRTIAGGLLRGCVDDYNHLASIFNSKLESEIQRLNTALPGSNLVYLDLYDPLLDLINTPAKEGFEVVDRGCCGTGLIEVLYLCNPLDVQMCEDASTFVFWDSFHPSEHAYRVLVRDMMAQNYN